MTRQYLLAATLAFSGCADEKGTTQSDNPSNSPTERCEGEAARPAYADADGDGFGDPADMVLVCGAEPDRVDNDGDCNDNDPGQHPDATEVCDGIDNNCDGVPDDDSATDATDWYTDHDGDGFGAGPPMGFGCAGADGQVTVRGDCDDDDPDVNPHAEEACDDIDNDCNGSIDDGPAIGGQPFYEDSDDDGWGSAETEVRACSAPAGWVERADDCDDGAPSIHPDAGEICDAVDDNCDGHLDNGCAIDVSEDGIALARAGVSTFGTVATGDFTGDGVDDIMAFAPMDHRVLLYAGPILEDGSPPSRVIESSTDALLPGAGLHAQADFDGDGALDLLVPTPLMTTGAVLQTSVRLYTETHADDFDLDAPAAELTSTEENGGAWGVGGIVYGALTASAPLSAVLTREGGDVVLWEDPTEDLVISSDTPMARYPAIAIAAVTPTVGDLNSDGADDLVLPTGAGFDVFLGPLDPAGWADSVDVTWHAVADGSDTAPVGSGLCTADLSGDGHAELAYSEPITDSNDAVRLASIETDELSGSSALTPEWSLDIPRADTALTLKCTDIDGDGHTDLLVQNYGAKIGDAVGVGQTSIVFGPIALDTFAATPDRVMTGSASGEARGVHSGLADLDLDGVGDVILSALDGAVEVYAVGPWTGSAWTDAD